MSRLDLENALVRKSVDGLFRLGGRLSGLVPFPRGGQSFSVKRDVAYINDGRRDHLLDVYRPDAGEPLPVILYVHGGGFRILSKETHQLFGAGFASRGYLVFNINYRLAPQAPFPCGLQDVCVAFSWVLENAASYGGDPQRIALAGESAGANLVTALTLACCFERSEPYARRVFQTGQVPRAVLPACGLLQVSEPQRLIERNDLSPFVRSRLRTCCSQYLGPGYERRSETSALADPLLILEGEDRAARPLPPFFAAVGTADPLLDDTRRLARALEAHGGHCDARYYPGEIHAFHALHWRQNARDCWRRSFAFLERHLAPPQVAVAASI